MSDSRRSFSTMNMTRAVVAAIAVAGLMGIAGEAHATKPAVWAHCSESEAGDLRYTDSGRSVACIYHSRRETLWTPTAEVDPVVREKGQYCTNAYPVARNRRGKALMCVQGEWSYGP